jgi:hypothetical protein
MAPHQMPLAEGLAAHTMAWNAGSATVKGKGSTLKEGVSGDALRTLLSRNLNVFQEVGL